MTRRLHFEQLQRITGNSQGHNLGHSALRLYEDALERALVWRKSRRVFIATEDADLRGVANMEIRLRAKCAYLIGLAIVPAHRDQGIGRFMMGHLLQYAADQGCSEMQVIPKPEVEGFYARLGFVRRSENSSYWIRNV